MHFFVIKSKTIKILTIMTIVCLLLCIGFNGRASAEVFFGYSTRKVPVYCVDTTQKQVAISFDSAWGAEKTEGILDLLKEYDVSATFFLVGIWVDEYPEKVRAIDEAGMEIACHSDTHPDMTKISAEQIKTELEENVSKIKSVTGKDVKFFRPPFGAYNNLLIDSCEQMNLIPVQWDVDTLDWKGLSGAEMTNRVLSKVKNGSIILMHNNSENILDGLRMILDRLTLKGYKIGSVGDLVYNDNYTIDRNGVQHAS